MGEQSVGKGFILNHIVGTSFAGNEVPVRTTGQFPEFPSFEIGKLTKLRGCMDVCFFH